MRHIALVVAVMCALMLGACSAYDPSIINLDTKAAPNGPQRTEGLKFLASADPDEAMIDGKPARYRGIILNAMYEDPAIDAESWKADLLMPDGNMVTIAALYGAATELNRTVPEGTYIACNPDGTGAVDLDTLVILQEGVIKGG